jgi:hypothetical protein
LQKTFEKMHGKVSIFQLTHIKRIKSRSSDTELALKKPDTIQRVIMRTIFLVSCILSTVLCFNPARAADVVPNEVQLPGTQPLEIGNLESPDKCDNCHGGYNSSVEPAYNWRGSMMAQAGRDPIFWATLAIAEQDFDGVGDLCIRCHSTGGWLAGRSTPTDGSALAAGDADGVECDYCHKLTHPDDQEHQGEMNAPFVANDGSEGWHGSGMSSIWGGSDKLGPYLDADARHQFMQSKFHREPEFCGTCHDVSNSVVGDLAHNHGRLQGSGPVEVPGIPGGPLTEKAAFNYAPYRFGAVERTFSEFKSGALSTTRVDDFPSLPDELRGGVLEAIYQATYNGITADYEDGTARFYTCQSCHMRAVTGTGANKRGVPVRSDLPLHDLTGGNYWMASVIEYLDDRGKLRLGGGMTAAQRQAMHDGALRAQEQLQLAATLEVEGNRVRIVNHTGHKLITGYPEGRRMWLNVKWFDSGNVLISEDGAYGPIGRNVDGVEVESILDLDYPHIFQAHMGMTQEWAAQLLELGYPSGLVLDYDRMDDSHGMTLGQLAAKAPGTVHETFHFALNNAVVKDNRIPTYGMSYNEARRRNASPVPASQYGGGEGGIYEHFADIPLSPTANAVSATIELLYQPTSWEYIQFLEEANNGTDPAVGGNAFLGEEGQNLREAWLNAEPFRMAAPLVMASATWGNAPQGCDLGAPTLTEAIPGNAEVALAWAGPAEGDISGYSVYLDQDGKSQWVADTPCPSPGCATYTHGGLTNGQNYCYKVTAHSGPDCESAASNTLCATPTQPGQETTASAVILGTGVWVREGKGKNATETFVATSNFAPGDEVVIRLHFADSAGSPLANATAELTISGPAPAVLTSANSNAGGGSEARWATQAPNRKGNGGTPQGSYTISISAVNADGHAWDGEPGSVTVTLDAQAQNNAAMQHGM